MSDQEPAPKLHVDADWKAEAQAEKERLAAKEAEASTNPDGNTGAPGELPEANFKSLMGLLASQAVMGLGAYPDPETGQVVVDLVGSKFAIDLLGVLEQKTAGNISDEESKELSEVLAQLRSRFVQIAEAVAQQQMKAGAEGMQADAPPPGGVIETP